MGSKIGSFGRLYASKDKAVFVSSPNDCPKVVISESSGRLKDDFSKGFRARKALLKATLG